MAAKYETKITQKGFKVLVISQAPTDENGIILTDLYVRIPTADRFILFISEGEKLDTDRINKLYQHPDPRLYTPTEQWQNRHKKIKIKDSDPNKIGAETQEIITSLYLDLLDGSDPSEGILKKLSQIANEITDSVLSDSKQYEDQMLKQLSDLSRLEDSYAIRALAILFSLANGYTSKKAIMDIHSTSTIMDVNLLDFIKEDVDNYYRDPNSASEDFLRAYKQHPAKANLMATTKLPFITDSGLQIILNHHEFHNGSGFPRGTRTKPLPDIIKIMSLAVDVFEVMKKAELNEKKISLAEALKIVGEFDVEIHTRRHQSSIIDKVFSHLGLNEVPKEDKK